MSPLQAARVVADEAGFDDIDVKDCCGGHYTIVATGPKMTITSKGSTMIQAVENLMDKLGWVEEA